MLCLGIGHKPLAAANPLDYYKAAEQSCRRTFAAIKDNTEQTLANLYNFSTWGGFLILPGLLSTQAAYHQLLPSWKHRKAYVSAYASCVKAAIRAAEEEDGRGDIEGRRVRLEDSAACHLVQLLGFVGGYLAGEATGHSFDTDAWLDPHEVDESVRASKELPEELFTPRALQLMMLLWSVRGMVIAGRLLLGAQCESVLSGSSHGSGKSNRSSRGGTSSSSGGGKGRNIGNRGSGKRSKSGGSPGSKGGGGSSSSSRGNIGNGGGSSNGDGGNASQSRSGNNGDGIGSSSSDCDNAWRSGNNGNHDSSSSCGVSSSVSSGGGGGSSSHDTSSPNSSTGLGWAMEVMPKPWNRTYLEVLSHASLELAYCARWWHYNICQSSGAAPAPVARDLDNQSSAMSDPSNASSAPSKPGDTVTNLSAAALGESSASCNLCSCHILPYWLL